MLGMSETVRFWTGSKHSVQKLALHIFGHTSYYGHLIRAFFPFSLIFILVFIWIKLTGVYFRTYASLVYFEGKLLVKHKM